MPRNIPVPEFHAAEIRQGGAPAPELVREFELDTAFDLWKAAAGENDVPSWPDIDLMAFPAHLQRGTMVADHHPDRNDYFIRFWGIDLADVFGIELSQKWLSKADHNGFMDSFAATAHETLAAREPAWLTHEITSPNGLRRVFPVLRLPLICRDTGRGHVMTVENIAKSMKFFAED